MSKQTQPGRSSLLVPALILAIILIVLAAGCTEGSATPGAPEGGATMEIPTPEDGSATPTVGGTGTGKSRGLSPDDRRLLAEAIARADKEVVVLVVAAPGQSGQVVAEIENLGGVIRSHHEDLDYVSASVPTDKVEVVAQLTSVQTVSLADEIPIPDPRP